MNLRRLRRGEKPKLGHINQFSTAVAELRKQVRQLSGEHRPAQPPAVPAWALNGTGQDLRMGDAAAIQSGVATSFERLVEDGPVLKLRAFQVGSSAADDSGNWVVAKDEIKANEIGRVWVAGVCPARATGSGNYVTAPDDGGPVLVRGASGAKILQEIENTVAGEGEKWVLIRIGTIAKDQPGSEGGETVGDPPIIDSEDGTAGTADTGLKSDTKPGLKLSRDTGTPTKNVSGLKAVTAGFQVDLAGAGNDTDERAATVLATNTLEVVPDDGVQVKIGKNYNQPSGDYSSLTVRSGGTPGTKNGLIAKVRGGGCLQVGSDGLEVKLKANAGLQVDSNELATLIDPVAGNQLSVSSAGLKVPAASASLSSAQDALASDHNWTNGEYEACSLALGAGTWLVLWTPYVLNNGNTSWQFAIKAGSTYAAGGSSPASYGEYDSGTIQTIVSGGQTIKGCIYVNTGDLTAKGAAGTQCILTAIKIG